MLEKHSATLRALAWAALLLPNAAFADLYQYDPGLGTVPTLQGWTIESVGGTSINAVEGGTFGQVSVLPNSLNSWSIQTSPMDFTSSHTATIEARLSVKMSDKVDPAMGNDWRSGYALSMTDALDHHFIVGISSAGVRLTNDLNWLNPSSSAWAPLSTAAFNDYKLVARDGMAELFVNDVPTLTLEVGAPGDQAPRTNTFRFGDVSLMAGSMTSLQSFTGTTAPEPSSLVLALGMSGAAFAVWRRKKQRRPRGATDE